MALFESMLTLVLVAIVLLQASRRFAVPYPTILATAGVAVALLPWTPDVAIDPHLALALFIAPALLDAAFDLPPRELRRYWAPLVALAGVAVLLTAGAVAALGVYVAGLPLAAAIALGAIVAPPDAAASAAVLGRFSLPRRTLTVLKGESLLNDAVALLLYTAAVAAAAKGDALASLAPELALATPAGVVLGYATGRAYLVLTPRFAGARSATLFEFVVTFGVWVVAERLHISAVLAVVVFAMTVAREAPDRQPARDRVRSLAVWETTVFLLNVVAFMLMGLQGRAIVERLPPDAIWDAFGFAGLVFLVVVAVRITWVMAYNRVLHLWYAVRGRENPTTLAQGVAVSWCGMRGLVTLATALALPGDFPSRDLIVLSGFVVVLGTLVLQGVTLGPLLNLLDFKPDHTFAEDHAAVRVAMLKAACDGLKGRSGEAATQLRAELDAERKLTEAGEHRSETSPFGKLRMEAIAAMRATLSDYRRSGRIGDDVFHTLQQEIDWAELSASPPDRIELAES